MGFPLAAHWKEASDKEIASLETHAVLELVPITSVPAGQRGVVGTRSEQLLSELNKQLMDRFEMVGMGGVSSVLGMNVIHYRKKGTIMIVQKDYTGDDVCMHEEL